MSMGLIGVCSWSLSPNNPQILGSQLLKTGVEGVQLALGPVLEDENNWGQGGDKTKEVLSHAGIQLLSGMMATVGEDYSTLESIRATGGLRPDETWDANLLMAKKTAELAHQMSLKLVTLHAGFIPEDRADPERSVILGRLSELASIFDSHGIQLGLETGQESAVTLLELLDELACPNVGVNFDPANMILYNMGDPIEAIRILSPHILQVHIKDAMPTEVPGRWGSEVPVGSGAVDWNQFLGAVSHLPKVVNMVIEREAGSHRLEDILKALSVIEAYRLAKPGVVS